MNTDPTVTSLHRHALIQLLLMVAISPVSPAHAFVASSEYDGLGVTWDGFSYRVNAATGTDSLLNRPDKLFNAMARDSAGQFIASDFFNALYSVNPTSGSATFLTNLSGFGDSESIRGLAFLPSERLMAVVGTPFNGGIDLLYEIHPATGQATKIGPTGMEGLQSLAVSGLGTLFSFDLEDHGLVRINPDTGAALDVSALYGAQGASIQSLAFAPDGTLFGIGQGTIYTVNRANGALTHAADFDLDVRGFEFLIPEPSTLSMAGMLMVFCFRRRKSRRFRCS